MTRALIVHSAGPGVTVQDFGRPGWLAEGLSRGGAVDTLALLEGAALLGQPATLAALELAGMGGEFEATEDLRIALTGAPMRARIDGADVAWAASHPLPAGARLSIGGVQAGAYGYLHVGGGIATPEWLGARSAHLVAGIGAPVAAGAQLPVGRDPGGRTGRTLDRDDRFAGGELRIAPGIQTAFFSEAERARFTATTFRRDARANRMGMRLASDGEGFHTEGGLNVLSEVILPGDIQITGDGTPFVLLAECQTTGGYPRIGTVIPPDMPRVAQAPAGAPLRFRFVTVAEAIAACRAETRSAADLARACRPLVRDPRDMPDLLSYHLADGAISATDPKEHPREGET